MRACEGPSTVPRTPAPVILRPFNVPALHGTAWCLVPGTALGRGEPAVVVGEALATKGPRTSPQVPPILASQVTPAKSPSFLQPPFSVLSNSEDKVISRLSSSLLEMFEFCIKQTRFGWPRSSGCRLPWIQIKVGHV